MVSLDLIDDLLPVLGAERVLLIGEVPGTQEFPALIADLALHAVASGQPLVVGLEVPFTEPLDGEEWGSFWQRAPQFADGRSSLAMAELVTTLADITAAGHPLVTVGLDGPWAAPGSAIDTASIDQLSTDRDQAMAGHFLAAMDANSGAAGLILAGTDHTGVLRGSQTMGSVIAPWFPGSIALMGLATGGAVLSLTPDGPAPRPITNPADLGEGAVWSDEPGADGHHGFVNLGAVSPAQRFPAE